MNELTKRIVSCVLLAIIGLGCFFGISGWQSSPETHKTSIEYLNEKQTTVMKLTAASTAASAAISALPGDTGSAIAEKMADLTSDFLIVLCRSGRHGLSLPSHLHSEPRSDWSVQVDRRYPYQ